MKEKETFIMKTKYREYMRANGLSDGDVGRLMLAVFDYQATGEAPDMAELGPVAFTIFNMIKVDLDVNTEKYNKKCKVLSDNRNQPTDENQAENQKSTENTKISRKSKNLQKSTEISVDIDIDNDIDSVIDSVIDSDELISSVSANASTKDINSARAEEDKKIKKCEDSVRAFSDPQDGPALQEDKIKSTYENLIGKYSKYAQNCLASHGFDEDVVCYAIEEAYRAGKPKLNYIEGVLRNLKQEGVTTVEAARARAKPDLRARDGRAFSDRRDGQNSVLSAPENSRSGTKIDEVERIETERRMAKFRGDSG